VRQPQLVPTVTERDRSSIHGDVTSFRYEPDRDRIRPGRTGRGAPAATLGQRAAVVERGVLGGAFVNTGTVPSKTLRAAIVQLTSLAPSFQRDPSSQHEPVRPAEVAFDDRTVLDSEGIAHLSTNPRTLTSSAAATLGRSPTASQ
jgi:hypothetical protein